MLKLTNIKKDYVLNGGDTVSALKGIDLEFRPSEFVSILGPSGCGKTTMLNIIGGLDRYTDGDLSIDGISTKHYSDVDWDAYRNIRIGFIFQSYNLISHVDILTNVEMALLLAGVSKQERRKRAIKALEDVGLGEHIHKKPNQLSGGQMQRVSIARALINNPSIILADEPTGALDSNTSVQVMEILKEISYNKLIIMVTHNPELALQYSNRVVRFKDGLVVDDTNPYSSAKEKASQEIQEDVVESLTTDEATEEEQKAVKEAENIQKDDAQEQEGEGKKKKTKIAKIDFSKHKAKKQRKNLLKKTSMSYASAIKLSFTNLMTKKGRTFMTAFAGSIGIIGVALVLAISNGFSAYITNVQKTMLSGYPIAITSSAASMESMMGTYMNVLNPDRDKFPSDSKVFNFNIGDVIADMIHDNDLSDEYLAYFEDKKSVWEDKGYVDSVYYNYGYDYAVYNSKSSDVGKMIGANLSTVNWQELVGDQTYIENNFDIIGGRYPSSPTELLLVTDSTNSVMSVYLEGMGLDGFNKSNYIPGSKVREDVPFDEILGDGTKYDPVSFYIPKNNLKYVKAVNEETGKEYYKEKTFKYRELEKMYNADGDKDVYKVTVVGIIRPKEGKEYSPISQGIAYPQELSALIRADAINSEVAKFQEQVDYNPLTGKNYDAKFDLSKLDLNNLMGLLNGGATAETKDVVAQKIGASNRPSAISIYASDFKNKDHILADLDAWNNEHEEKKQIAYTDSAAIMIKMISQIINIITIALVCFSSVSLVVSSIMIGIITYVSVVERTKEIGILRSLGARKRDISNIFNAETFIIGLASGTIGVLLTYLLSIPINLIVTAIESTITGICMLNPLHALLLVVLSILLTSIAGIVPSRAAAKKDPVIALRTD